MAEFLLQWVQATWEIVIESAFLFMIGLILAGGVWYLFRKKDIAHLVTGGRGQGVWRAALFGLPLPLCSCSVLPVATQLRHSGASRAAVASFLISTPESGVDSVLLTYSLTDPILTVARPLTALVTALAAGGVETLTSPKDDDVPVSSEKSNVAAACCCDDGCEAEASAKEKSKTTPLDALKYAFTTLIGELAPYLFVGFVLAGLVSVLLGDSIAGLPDFFRSGWGGYVGAILVGLPMYICASSSTPLAAVLVAGGFSPGMVLVFMLVGPATNVSALVVLNSILGRAGTVRYVLVIIVVSVLAGLVTDQAYQWLGVVPHYRIENAGHMHAWYHTVSATFLSALVIWYSIRAAIGRIRSFSLKPS